MIGKTEFATAALNLKNETFIIYMTFLIGLDLDMEVHLFYQAYIAYLKADEASIVILSEYTDFVDVFSLDFAAKFLKHIVINDYLIYLVNG